MAQEIMNIDEGLIALMNLYNTNYHFIFVRNLPRKKASLPVKTEHSDIGLLTPDEVGVFEFHPSSMTLNSVPCLVTKHLKRHM